MKYFCSKCGKTTQYSFEMPKFCAFCGQSFGSKSASLEADSKRNKFLNELKLRKNIDQYDNVDNDTDLDSENINIDFKSVKAKFKLDIYQPKGESFGTLIDNPTGPIEKEFNKKPPIQKSPDQILEDFKKESASIRNYE